MKPLLLGAIRHLPATACFTFAGILAVEQRHLVFSWALLVIGICSLQKTDAKP